MEGPQTGQHRQLARDWVAIAGTALFVVAVHFLFPPELQARLAFDYGDFDPVTLYTSAFVHTDDLHLLSNLLGFLAAAVTAHLLCTIAQRRHWFRLTFVSFLLVLPVLVNLVSYAFITSQAAGATPVSRGFSGVAAGFVGFVFAALLQAMRRRFSRPVAWYLGVAIWLLLLLEVYVIYSGGVTVPVLGMVLVGWALCLWGLFAQGRLPAVEQPWQRVRTDAVWILLAVALLVSSISALFPAEIVADGAIRNVFAHGAGFLFGLGLSFVLLYAPSVVGRQLDADG
jgi:hypothetical protein